MEAVPISDTLPVESRPSSRALQPYKAFEASVDPLLGERVRADGNSAAELWRALTNVGWRGPDGQVVSYSSRAAGNVVAWVREEGDYMDWYCGSDAGFVADWVSGPLAEAGWSPTVNGLARIETGK